jgi:hypothetical protein
MRTTGRIAFAPWRAADRTELTTSSLYCASFTRLSVSGLLRSAPRAEEASSLAQATFPAHGNGSVPALRSEDPFGAE